MSNSLLLDILFCMMLSLLALIGFWRGATAESVSLAGLLLGWELGRLQAKTWGTALERHLDLSAGASSLAIVSGCALAGWLALGGGGATALGCRARGLVDRCAGALLAGINGMILLAALLGAAQTYVASDRLLRILHDCRLASWLTDDLDVVLAVTVALLGGVIVLALVVRSRASHSDSRWSSDVLIDRNYGEHSFRKKRLDTSGESIKLEPVVQPKAASSAVFAKGSTVAYALTAGDAFAQDRPVPGWRGRADVGESWLTISRAPHSAGTSVSGTQATPPAVAPDVTRPASRCAGCGEVLRFSDQFCSRCGRTTTAELQPRS